MINLRDHKKLFVFGKRFAGFAGMLLILLCTFSCSNLMVNDGGSLVIAVPGARAATASSFTIKLTGSNGATQNETVSGGSTVQFDDLAPDTYTISVEGKNKDGVLVYSGTKSATVTAGETSSVIVELEKLVGSLTVDFSESVTSSATEFKVELNIGDTLFKGKEVPGVTSVQFDDLAPGAYNIVVEGMDASGAVVLYGTDSATVEAGATASAEVDLGEVVHDFNSLKNAVTVGGTIFIGSDIEFTETINIVVNAVNIMAMNDVTLTSSQKMFQIEEGGKLTLASESKALTLLTTGSVPNISLNGGEFVLEDNVTITGSYNDGCVNFGYSTSKGGTFIMNGGTIIGNGSGTSRVGINIDAKGSIIMNGGTISNFDTGVTLNNNANFTMTGGRISDNSSKGVDIKGSGTPVFTISGSAVVDTVSLTSTATTAITVGGVLTGSTPVATIIISGGYEKRTEETANPVLINADGQNFVSTEYQKFAVGDKSYTIDSSGKLQQVQ